MRNILIAAAIAGGAALACGPALAQQTAPAYQPGSPQQMGSWCKVVTDGAFGQDTYGYYKRCSPTSATFVPSRRHRR